MRSSCYRAIVVAALSLTAISPAFGLPLYDLHVSANSSFFIPGSIPVGPNQTQDSSAGPIAVDVEGGKVLRYGAPDFPPYSLETTLYARAESAADYGTNAAGVESNLRATSGTDRGLYESIDYQGNLPDARNSSSGVSTFTESGWTDVFTITGGTGVATAQVGVVLDGSWRSGYGANGDIWYQLEPSLETFGRNGYGFLNYGLRVSYDQRPPGYDPENGPPINYETGFLTSVEENGVLHEVFTGTFLFEYDVPFALQSNLSISGYNGITIDALHTVTLSQFILPDDATGLTALSGHLYPVAGSQAEPVPEPATIGLLGGPFVLMLLRRRRLTAMR